MSISSENLRIILGLKLKNLRQERGYSLKKLAASAGLSISYLSEIEKGKKYPKPDKLLALAQSLGVAFDELVSVQVDESLHPLTDSLRSQFFKEFPFELFGFEAQDIFSLLSSDPVKAGALFRTFLEIGQMYDVRVEHFLFAALRSYQQLHSNYFGEIEEEARAFRAEVGVEALGDNPETALRRRLERHHNYRVDYDALRSEGELSSFRSVFADGTPPILYVNPRLNPIQRAFVLGRELGYRNLGLKERATTSSWLKVESFEQVLNNFKASYFAGAVLIDEHELMPRLKSVLAAPSWNESAFLDLLGRFHATPEMMLYRMGQLMPKAFGLHQFFFLRITQQADGSTTLSKVFNQSRLPLPQGFWLDEHYCRRWAGLRLLAELGPAQEQEPYAVRVQRSRFVDTDNRYFVFALSRPLSLTNGARSCVSLGFRMNDAFRGIVGFADDPTIEEEAVNVTCERCPLSLEACSERVAGPLFVAHREKQRRKEEALAELLGD